MIVKSVDGVAVQKHPGGRPPKVVDTERAEVLQAFEDYVDVESYPTVVDFCATNKVARKYHITKHNINDWQEFSTLRKEANDKQERFTEVGVLKGKVNPTWAIFKLKQPAFGWTDKQEVEHSGTLEIKRGMNPEELNGIIDRGGQGSLPSTGSQSTPAV
jgi:hypothetical protein